MLGDFDPWELAASGGQIHRTLSAGDLPRVSAAVRRIVAPVDLILRGATSTAGLATLEGRLEARVELTCQRCLKPMELGLLIDVKLAIVESESGREEPAPEFDPMVVEAGSKLSLPDLVSEELLLALPLAPVHSAAKEAAGLCLPAAEREAYLGADHRTHRPFADLARLLNSRDT